MDDVAVQGLYNDFVDLLLLPFALNDNSWREIDVLFTRPNSDIDTIVVTSRAKIYFEPVAREVLSRRRFFISPRSNPDAAVETRSNSAEVYNRLLVVLMVI